MTRYIRLVDAAGTMESTRRIFDLQDGSLDDSRPRGKMHGFDVWSAETLLDALESLVQPGKLIYVTGYDSDEDPESTPEMKEESELQRKLRLFNENVQYGRFDGMTLSDVTDIMEHILEMLRQGEIECSVASAEYEDAVAQDNDVARILASGRCEKWMGYMDALSKLKKWILTQEKEEPDRSEKDIVKKVEPKEDR